MTGFDILFTCTKIKKSNSNNKFSVIPTTHQKYIYYTFSVWLNCFLDKNGVTKMLMKSCVSIFLSNIYHSPRTSWFFAQRTISIPRQSIQCAKNSVSKRLTEKRRHLSLHIHILKKTTFKRVLEKSTRRWRN